MLTGESLGGITAIKDHQLVTSGKSRTGPDIAEEGSRVTISIIFELPKALGYQQLKAEIPENRYRCDRALGEPVDFHSRCEFELFCLFSLVCMSSIVYYCKIIRAVIFVAEVGKLFDQGCIPAVGGYLEIVGLEAKFVPEKVSQLSYLFDATSALTCSTCSTCSIG